MAWITLPAFVFFGGCGGAQKKPARGDAPSGQSAPGANDDPDATAPGAPGAQDPCGDNPCASNPCGDNPCHDFDD